MKSYCADCGHKITSNTNAWEILFDKWINKLEPMKNVVLVCDSCFTKYYPTLMHKTALNKHS